MKTLNVSNRYGAGVIASLTVLCLAACGGSGGGGSSSSPAPTVVAPASITSGFGVINASWGQNCPSCSSFGTPQVILSGIHAQTYAGDGVFSLDILVPAQFQLNGNPSAILNYQGPMALQGTLTINGASQNFCGITPGVYTINTTTPGIESGTSFQGVTVQAVGPGGTLQMYSSGVSFVTTNGQAPVVVQGGPNQMGMNTWLVASPNQSCPVHVLD